MFELDDDGKRPPIQLPNEMLLFIANSLDDRDCVATALSGAFDGFASLYDAERKEAAISIGYRHHFLSNPNHWTRFLSQNSFFPSSITVFDVTNCYWLPAELICDALAQLPNLEQLNVNGTQVSLPNLARVFTSCPKITQLEFKFVEKSWEEVLSIVGKQKMDIVIGKFKKLTSLKVSTWCLNPKDYLDDPWVLIIRILSWCRDCVALAVEIAYMGDDDDFVRETPPNLNRAERKVDKTIKKTMFPKLEWMTNLKKLVLIKYGRFSLAVRSLMLDNLCAFLFTEERAPSSLECVWVEGFHLAAPLFPHWLKSPLKKSYTENDDRTVFIDLSEARNYQMALNDESIEHLGGIVEFPSMNQRREHHHRPYLPNLKRARVIGHEDENQQRLNDFIRDHPNLEWLSLECDYEYVPSMDLRLSKLTTLSVEWSSTIISEERMDILAKFCPNIQTLRLLLRGRDEVDQSDDGIEDVPPDASSISTIGFKNLISLSLYAVFQLYDGAFLISVIKESPNLRSLHLDGTFEPDSFLPNLEKFLSLAIDLRDLRLKLNFNFSDPLIVLFLKSILKCCPNLERLVLLEDSTHPDGSRTSSASRTSISDHSPDLENFLLQFSTEMSRLICCCIIFLDIPNSLRKRVNGLIAKKVTPNRPSLWFHVGNITPDEDLNTPLIHFLEMLDPIYYFPLPAL